MVTLDNELLNQIPPDKCVSCFAESTEDEIVQHDFAKKEFQMLTSDGSKAYVKYQVLSDRELHFLTTQVPASQQGKGLGAVLVKAALDFCVKEQMKFRSSCWYIDGYLAKNPTRSYRQLFVGK